MLIDSTFWDRTFFLMLGMCIGSMMGWTSFAWKVAREAQREAHEVHDEIVRLDAKLRKRKKKRQLNEDGLMHTRVWGNVALAAVVVLTAYAAVTSQISINRTNDLVNKNASLTAEIVKTQNCTESVIIESLQVLAARTKLNGRSASANLDLQKAQAEFLSVSSVDDQSVVMEAFQDYLNALTHFVTVAGKVALRGQEYPYPRAEEYRACLNRVRD